MVLKGKTRFVAKIGPKIRGALHRKNLALCPHECSRREGGGVLLNPLGLKDVPVPLCLVSPLFEQKKGQRFACLLFAFFILHRTSFCPTFLESKM